MTKTLEAVVRRRWLPPEYAVREVVAFERRFGKKHLALACHAALPLILTPELVNLIRINFLDTEDISWIAESDLLLSPLCRPIQEDIYEVEPCVREVLLVELEEKFPWRRPFQLAEFLHFYLDKQPDWKLRAELTRTQKWIAKAYLDPDTTIQEITQELEKSLPEENPVLGLSGQSYFPHLVEILAEPLERTNLWDEHQYLVNTTRALAKLLAGEREGLREEVEVEEVGKGELILISPGIGQLLQDPENEPQPTTSPNFFAYDEAWVGRESLINNLISRIRGSCRLLVLVGITGIGKTALGERLAVESKDWFEDWNNYLQENFDNQEQSADFGSVAARLLEKCGEPITSEEHKDTQRLLNRLVRHLQENRYLIQIDSLDTILEGNEEEGWSDFIDEWWVKFFEDFLKRDFCKSSIILTSLDFPQQIEEKGHRFQNFLYFQPVSGLEKPEQLALFGNTGLDVNNEAEGRPFLERIGQAYEGHPLALRVIAGEIVNHPFNKNVLAYWKKYGNEVEEVEKAIEEAISGRFTVGADDQYNLHKYTRDLRRNVKSRLENTFNRLKTQVPDAYKLLLETSVYRGSVPEDFWLSHLEDWDIDEEAQEKALNILRDRYLVEELIDENNQVMLKQHNLIRGVSLEHLKQLDKLDEEEEADISNQNDREEDLTNLEIPPDRQSILTKLGIEPEFVKSIQPRWKRQGYRAVVNWLTKYKPQPDASNLEKVTGLLESFYHLCELEDWETASKILVSHLETPTQEELYNQLGTWGYYYQQINLCKKLIHKLNYKLDIELLTTFGNSYYALGDYSIAINYLEQSLKTAQQIDDYLSKSNALVSLGKVYEALGDYSRAIKLNEQSLSITKEINNRKGEAQALINLGVVYYDIANYVKSMSYSEQGLSIAIEINDKQSEGIALGNLGNVSLALGQYQKAIYYYQQYLAMAREIGDRLNEGRCLGTLGNAYKSLGEYKRAIEYYQQSLIIAKEIGDRRGEGEALYNLGNTFIQLNQYSEALKYLQASLTIFSMIGSRANEAKTLKSLAQLYQNTGNLNLALEYCDQGLAIATELQIPLAEECQKLKNQLMEQD
ncbi:tetratricopeptide repeat protein [Mastigocoleus testarum]|uniref:Uncharacterized protein n=1 Tax=Mastigocoleus testarum BC008 TaxID=371196 RepID=A0A0V7ZQ31_9CYAN|nr:tetratricopeptide repeat protein [Mastigocoleus testarum]KST66732.1 hypothetical protein BC008_26435 [Mastigocoleus testarum BC008]